jgi:hypothetical protein
VLFTEGKKRGWIGMRIAFSLILACGRAIAAAGIRRDIGAADGLGLIRREQSREPGAKGKAYPPTSQEGS